MLEKYGFCKVKFVGRPATVVVGMSGGVDSSVAAYILKWQGYNVVGLFMKNWEEEAVGGFCSSEADFADVKRVAEVIGIPYYSVNFSRQYMESVFQVFLEGLKNGVTPNPDVLCNREVKFGPFLKKAFEIGADFVATGHYARVCRGKTLSGGVVEKGLASRAAVEGGSASGEAEGLVQVPGGRGGLACFAAEGLEGQEVLSGEVSLLKGVDEGKDQSYFLCGLSASQLSRVIFPIGGLLKSQVREIAKAVGLVTAEKKDSTGICFIGERKFRDFLHGYLGNQPGDIKTLGGEVVGRHIGLMYYTLGQRKGLGIGGTCNHTERWFVVRKDLENNVLYVNNGECAEMFTREVRAVDFNWIGGRDVGVREGGAKTRYRQPDQKCRWEVLADGSVRAVFEKPQRSVTVGQWLVLYDGDVCLGGGVIS